MMRPQLEICPYLEQQCPPHAGSVQLGFTGGVSVSGVTHIADGMENRSLTLMPYIC